MPKQRQFSLRMEDELYTAAGRMAHEERRSLASLVRFALVKLLAERGHLVETAEEKR